MKGSYVPSKQMNRLTSNHVEGKNPAEGTAGQLKMSNSQSVSSDGKNPDHPQFKHGGVGQDDVVKPADAATASKLRKGY
jgi:hypothetical protein